MTTELATYNIEDAFSGISGAKPAADIVATDHLTIALVGKPKVGKSWMAATMPPPVLIYDFDDRDESLVTLPPEIKQGIRVKTLVDAKQSVPTAFLALESDLSKLQYRKSQGLPIPKSFVFDSVTYLKRAIENCLFSQGLDKRSIKLSPTSSLLLTTNWDAVNGVEGAIQYLITEYAALGNICFVFHEKSEKDIVKSTAKLTAYTDQITVDPQYLAKVLSRFNEVYRITINSSQVYEVTCRPGYDFTASTTLLLDSKEKPNITDFLKKHQERLKTGEKPR